MQLEFILKQQCGEFGLFFSVLLQLSKQLAMDSLPQSVTFQFRRDSRILKMRECANRFKFRHLFRTVVKNGVKRGKIRNEVVSHA